MKPRVTVLDPRRHAGFLLQQRRDPVTQEPFLPGDRVVLCAGGCGSAFFESSWQLIGGRHCGQSGTLKGIEVDGTVRRFWKRPGQKVSPGPAGGADAPAGSVGSAREQAPTQRRPAALMDIPLTLREVPISLREAIGLREI